MRVGPPRTASSGRLGVALVCLAACKLAACKVSGAIELSSPPAPAPTPAAEPPPDAVRIVRKGDRLTYENGAIEFATGSATLRGRASEDVFDALSAALRRYPRLVLRVEGHTDSRGDAAANRQLSRARARAIADALVERGVARERLTAVGLGEDAPTRPEPAHCRGRSEHTVPPEHLVECDRIWTHNRRAAFVVTDGADSLPTDGAALDTTAPPPAPPPPPTPDPRPDWALRLIGGHALAYPARTFHGGHLGLALHTSRRFGAHQRGYIGGGPRLHYRGLRHRSSSTEAAADLSVHQFGPEGDLLIGGGSHRVVGLVSLRLGLGLSALRGSEITRTTRASVDTLGLTGWALGGLVVLGKLGPRWSLGGHAEAGVTRISGLALVVELGLDIAWHFGRGRRDGT